MEYTVRTEYKQCKRVSIRVSREGEVILVVPYGTPLAEANAFLESKRGWIERALAKEKERRENRAHSGVERTTEELVALLDGYVKKWSKEMGVRPSSWRLSDMQSKWGVCNSANRELRFSTMLLTRSDECVEYVVIHELAHLKHPNHSKSFYSLVGRFCPDYREREDRLKGYIS
ncbi:MAG: M48 family metallopeptidase [Christensenellaceae bacterium]